MDPTAGQIGFVELSVPLLETSGLLSLSELAVSNVATAGQVGMTFVTTSNVATGGQVGQTFLIAPFLPTAGQVGQAFLGIYQTPTAGRVGHVAIVIPQPTQAAEISVAVLQVPKTYATTFQLSNGTVAIFQAANLEAIQAAGQINHVALTSAGVYYTEPDDIEIAAIHSDDSGNPEDAVLSANVGALSTKTGTYRTTKGFLSADKFIQDETYYNDHTYVVRVAESFDRWRTIYKKILHPAGFNLIGEFVDVMTPPAFSLTAEDATVDES